MHTTVLPTVDLSQQPSSSSYQPPAPGAPQRDAVGSIIDGTAVDLCQQIHDLKAELDRMQQQCLQRTAHAKDILNSHTDANGRLKNELAHIRGVIAEVREQMEK